jgi:hypothetical protein
MRKLGQQTYKRLLAQAEEAKELKQTKLADTVLSALGPVFEENARAIYTQKELDQTIYQNIWKMSVEVISYHDLTKVDIQKVDGVVNELKSRVIEELEEALKVSGKVGGNEPPVPGQE